MPNTTPDQNKPFLRALKCAYKLHKAGLSEEECMHYLIEAKRPTALSPLPSAATPVTDLLPATFNFAGTYNGAAYWQPIQDRLMAAAK
jgi:hypothetical protein